jgi:hypothetical protein
MDHDKQKAASGSAATVAADVPVTIEHLEVDIAKVNALIKKTGQDEAKLKLELQKVSLELEKVELEIKAAKQAGDKPDVTALRKEKEQLREEKNLLLKRESAPSAGKS